MRLATIRHNDLGAYDDQFTDQLISARRPDSVDQGKHEPTRDSG